ncbi:major facilitator superfamily domain-containing protein [Lipomyces doorenjongii]|uniref:major facilitator superfamily domain-containing protein n=1 Tax=Lipomyces doorenjongii TaxID=383834 RepID=UPI0034CFB4CC
MSIITRFAEEIGILTLIYASFDVHLLCFQRFIRMFAYGQVTIILALFFEALGITEDKTGLFMTSTLLGDVVISFLLTLVADKIGRRKILAAGAILMCMSGITFSYATNYWVLLIAAIVGVISPSGNEIGPFRAIEESTLAHLTDLKDRPDLYAWYSLLGSLGAALGTITSGWLVERLQEDYSWSVLKSYRVVFVLYSIIAVFKFAASVMLSPLTELEPVPSEPKPDPASAAERGSSARPYSGQGDSYAMRPLAKANESTDSLTANNEDETEEIYEEMNQFSDAQKKRSKWLFWVDYLPQLTPNSRKVVMQLVLLFSLDSFASGIATQSWLSYYFADRFGVKEGALGTLLFVTNLISAASSIVASSISKRLGPIITMVATHMPSSAVLAVLGFPSDKSVAMILLIVRSCTASMDVAPRQAFLSSIVTKEERTGVMGVVNVVRTLAQSAGPGLMGKFASLKMMPIGFLIAGLCKVAYDLGILVSFLGTQLQNN